MPTLQGALCLNALRKPNSPLLYTNPLPGWVELPWSVLSRDFFWGDSTSDGFTISGDLIAKPNACNKLWTSAFEGYLFGPRNVRGTQLAQKPGEFERSFSQVRVAI